MKPAQHEKLARGFEFFFFGPMWNDSGSTIVPTAYSAKNANSSEKISDFGTVALSFVCDKYYPIMD